MKRALVTLFILLLFSLSIDSTLRATQKAANQGKPVPIIQLDPKRSGPRAPFMVFTRIVEPLRLVIRDHDTWRDIWKRIHEGVGEVPSLPEINFSKEMVVFVALGGRPTSGYGIIIDSAYERSDRLEIVVRSVSPGKNCFNLQAGTAPIDIVRLPNIGHSVSFRETEEVHECK
jgi:hypothetical protein